MGGKRKSQDHILGDSQLDSYLLNSLPDALSESFEEHLLFCHRCQDRVVRRRTVVATIQEALARWTDETANQRPH
jgi:anti-sigma factor RsiW